MSTDIPPERETAVDRIWAAAASLEGIGLGLLLAGGMLVVQAVTSDRAVAWLEPLRSPVLVPFIAGLLAGASLLWLGAIWQRHFETESTDASPGRGGFTSRTLPTLGATGMLLGATTMVAVWCLVQAAGPTGSVVLAPGAKTEGFQSRIAGEEIEVMFPLRLHLRSLDPEGTPSVKVAFSTPDRDPFGQRRLLSGEPVDIEGFRVAPVGLSTEQGSLQATLRSRRDETIPATVGEGETFQLRPDGPEYQVRKIVKNYIDAVGPAVQLEAEQKGRFWVFTDSESDRPRPDVGHQMYVDSLQKAPGVLFRVTPAFPLWPMGVGGGLFVIGLALVLAFPERVRHRLDADGRIRSFNDAGASTEIDEEER